MIKDEKLETLNIDTSLYKTRLNKKFKNRTQYRAPDPLIVLSFIPGTILEIIVKPGQEVRKGDPLMILEAMKMQNMLKSGIDGRVKKILANKGDKVAKGTKLIAMEQDYC
jgi:biotin carboxyl carrier protein